MVEAMAGEEERKRMRKKGGNIFGRKLSDLNKPKQTFNQNETFSKLLSEKKK